ncbi:glycosyltransferase family 2 protein [Geodermatophilus sp. URMC 65]
MTRMRPGVSEKPIKLSVIICTRNRADALERCLAHCARSDLIASDVELVIVDNGSQDRTPDVIAKSLDALSGTNVVTLIESRPGLSFARNTGLAAASGEVVFFTDDDCLVPLNLRSLLLDFFRGTIDILAGDMVDPERREIVPRRRARRVLGPKSIVLAGDIVGACMAFRIAVLRRVGLFDTDFGAGSRWRCEDVDYMQRALDLGYSINVEPSLEVAHLHDRQDATSVRRAILANDYARGGFHAKHSLTDRRHIKWLILTSAQVARRSPLRAFAEIRGAVAYYRLSLRPWTVGLRRDNNHGADGTVDRASIRTPSCVAVEENKECL